MSAPPEATATGRGNKRELPLLSAASRASGELHPVTCSFKDPALEAGFGDESFRNNLIQIRLAHVLGIVLWVVWGLLVRGKRADTELQLDVRVTAPAGRIPICASPAMGSGCSGGGTIYYMRPGS